MNQDRAGKLWAGYTDSKVSLALLKNNKATTYTSMILQSLGAISALLETNNGLLVGGANGLAILRGSRSNSY